jgi:hypothetical protein
MTGTPRHLAPLRVWQKFRFTPCACGTGDLVRLRRALWMRWLFPRKRLYQCPHCGIAVFYGR